MKQLRFTAVMCVTAMAIAMALSQRVDWDAMSGLMQALTAAAMSAPAVAFAWWVVPPNGR